MARRRNSRNPLTRTRPWTPSGPGRKVVGLPDPPVRAFVFSDAETAKLNTFLRERDGPLWWMKLYLG